MKSQGLPMSTIVLLIIVVIVLAVVAIFFFSYYSKGSKSFDIVTCQELCRSTKALYAAGSTGCSKPAKDYCAGQCNTVMTACYMSAPNSAKYISCTGVTCAGIV